MAKDFRDLDDLKKFFSFYFDANVECSEISKQEISESFESRTLTKYQIRVGRREIGEYHHTVVFEKDNETKVMESGRMIF